MTLVIPPLEMYRKRASIATQLLFIFMIQINSHILQKAFLDKVSPEAISEFL